MPKDLLNLNRIPTLEELRSFFKENDFSASAIMDMDYNKLQPDVIESLEHIKKIMHDEWEPLSRDMGLKSDSTYYSKDNPLIALRDNTENLVASGVYKLLEEQLDIAVQILEQFMDEDGNFVGNVDEFTHNAVETLMKVMSYEETDKIVQENPAYEDFEHGKKTNYRATDFDRKWNHTRAKITTESLGDLEDNGGVVADGGTLENNIEEEVIAQITADDFLNSISEQDKKIINMCLNGMTHTEIANELGYKTHSAVTKRLHKLKLIFTEKYLAS